ncbi:MAG: bifunctional metallophosphatase/5'-nucleotidase [Bacteroidales bacterium]|nr:bifunctional metallophosphatase/5'-nucleotidase [Bacteroidales bacterium]
MKFKVIFAACLIIPLLALNAQESTRLTILHTNDFHSHLQGYAPESAYTPGVADNDHTVGGLSRIAGIISEVRSENPASTLVVDGGDCLMGTLFHSLETETGFQLPLMKKAGYDVIAMGNHDFDFGPSAYAEIIRKSSQRGEIPVMLMGNAVTDADDPADDAFEALFRDGLVRPYMVTERDGIKIGIFSLLGKDADESAPYAPPVTFEKIVKSGKKLVKALRNENCDVIICLSHSGVSRDKKGNWSGEDVGLARKVKGIDLIISGHTHTVLSEPLIVNGVPILQTGSTGSLVGRADLTVTGKGITLDSYSLIPVDDNVTADAEIQSEIEEHKLAVDKSVLAPLGLSYDMPVAVAPFTLLCDEQGDVAGSNLGVLMADAIHYYVNIEGPGADIAMIAAGVIRDPILPGTQSVADLFRVMSLGSGSDDVPGYPLSRLWVTGRELKNIAEILIMSSVSTPGHFCFYSHLRIEYNPDGKLLRKISKLEFTDLEGNVTEVNTSKDDTRRYSIVANSYMLDFVGIIKKMSFGLINVVPKDNEGKPLADMDLAVIDFSPGEQGIQEGKEWLALVKYLQQVPVSEEGGLPVIPAFYRNPQRSLVQTNSRR